MNLETVIGLEVHVELKTSSKIFSPAPAHFGAEPNSNTNVIDWGYPGVLPVMDKVALEFGMEVALALNCGVSKDTHFGRKNCLYPDNPKAYQISQSGQPIGHGGQIEIEVEGKKKEIRVERVRLEEDAGKNMHSIGGYPYADLNRQGTPLIEIVSKADMRSPEEAYAYLEALRSVIQFIEVSDVKMEEGSMCCDADISLRLYGQEELSMKAELKDLNSLSFVKEGLAFEEKRQAKVLLSGGEIQQKTRRFDETTDKTVLVRVRESSSDYRYFPEPDVPKFVIDDEWIQKIKASLPKIPAPRRERYIREFGLPEYDAMVLILAKEISDFFEAVLGDGADAKQASNWLTGEISACLNSKKLGLAETKSTPENLVGVTRLIADGTTSSKIVKKVFCELITGDGGAQEIVKKNSWVQLSDPGKLLPIVNEILDDNQQSVDDYENGEDRAVGFLVGQIMKATKGQADPGVVNKLLRDELTKHQRLKAKKAYIVYNPTSGKELLKKSLADIPQALEEAGFEASTYVIIPKPDSAKSEARRIAELGFDLVVATRDDGAISEVINGIAPLEHRPKMATIPAGMTNGYARALKIPRGNIKVAAEVIKRRQAVKMDIGLSDSSYFINIAADGYLTELTYEVPSELKSTLGYLTCLAKGAETLPRVKPIKMRLRYDGGEYIGNAPMFFPELTNSVRGFEQIAPDAKLDSGKFSLIIVKTVDIFEILHITALMLNGGRHVDDPRVIYTKTSSLFVETEDDISRPVMINLDGKYDEEAPMRFQNLHQHTGFFANADQILDEAVTGTDEEELGVVNREFVREVERLAGEDIDGDGKIVDETPNQKN